MSTLAWGPFCAGCLDFKNFCSCVVNFEDSTETTSVVATRDNLNPSPISVRRCDRRSIEHLDSSEDGQATQGHVPTRQKLSEAHSESESKAPSQTVSASDYDGGPGDRLRLGFGDSESEPEEASESPLVPGRAESNIVGVFKYHSTVIACVIVST